MDNVRLLWEQSSTYGRKVYAQFSSLPPEQRYVLYALAGVKAFLIATVLYIGPAVIFDATAKVAIWLSSQWFGAWLVVLMVIVVSFPPLIGYGTAITLCGLGWGVDAPATASHPAMTGSLLHAWLLASTACLLGATISFLTLQWLIRASTTTHRTGRHLACIQTVLDDPKFVAMSEAVRRRGLSMVVLIRFCPFPFCYSNLFFASLGRTAVPFSHFVIATALITPKLFLHVFVGARMYELMDSDRRAKLDGWAKFVNVVYIALGTLVGTATGWLVYRETKKILDQMELEQFNQHDPESATIPAALYRDRTTPHETPFTIDSDEDDDDHRTSPRASQQLLSSHAT